MKRENKLEKMLELFAKAVELKPDFTDAWYNFGIILSILGRYEEALDKFEKVVELSPNHKEAYNAWAVALGNLCKHKESIKKLEKAIEIDSDYQQAFINLHNILNRYGNFLFLSGEEKGAFKKYERAKVIKEQRGIELK